MIVGDRYYDGLLRHGGEDWPNKKLFVTDRGASTVPITTTEKLNAIRPQQLCLAA
jgi:hypothetical protein